MQIFNAITTILILGIIAVALLNGRAENRSGLNMAEQDSWKVNTGRLFWVMLIYGIIAIRTIGLTEFPGGLNQDGVMGAVDARALADYGTDRFGTWLPAHFAAWGVSQMSVLLSYLSIPFIKIMGLTKLALRLPMLIASLLGIAAVYGIVKRCIDDNAAIIVLFVLAINPWHFMQSRWAIDCNLFPHMFVFGLYFLIRGLKCGKYYYVSMVFFALSMYCYGVAFYMVPFFLLASCILLFYNKKITWRAILLCILVYFGISWPICGTMLINFMKWETVKLPFVTMPYFEWSVRSNDILLFSDHIGQQFISNLRSLLNVAFLQKEDLLWNSMKDFGTVYKCSMPLVILGGAIVFKYAVKGKELEKKTACCLLALFWIFSVFTGIMINGVNVNRINIIFYPHIIFLTIGIRYIIQEWKKASYILFLIFVLQGTLFLNMYFTKWEDQIEKVFYAEFLDAVEYVKDYNADHYYITPDTQYDGAWIVTEILTMFEFDIDSRYYRGETDRWKDKEIAYRDRFQYSNPPEEISSADTIYVFKTRDRNRFSEDEFSIVLFGDYGAAIPWNIANGT